jgi:P4 family phage/plasmid primase-like protien
MTSAPHESSSSEVMSAIPKELIKALESVGLKRFIRIRSHEKRALDDGWPDDLREPDDPTIQQWLRDDGNYGVVAGNGLVIVDLDQPDLFDKLPETFTVVSGSGGIHCYFKSSLEENGIIHKPDGKPKDIDYNLGNIQVQRKYVVGPGSIHPNGQIYSIKKNAPLAELTKETVESTFPKMVRWKATPTPNEFLQQSKVDSELTDARLTDIVPMNGLIQRGDEYQGPHPIHDSKTGHNFCVNPSKNLWHCFRCDSGGGVLHYIAMKEGILDCEDCLPGALTGKKFFDTVKIAGEKYGISIKLKASNPEGSKYFELDNQGHVRFMPIVFAKDMEKAHIFKTTRDNETVYVYNEPKGIYEPHGKNVIKHDMSMILDDDVRARYYADVLFYIKSTSYFDRPDKQANKIVLLNGILNVDTYELEPFSPDEFLQIRVPVVYDKEQNYPLILQFLKEVLGEEQLPLMQEWIGYMLYIGYPLHKAMILLGDGENGKTTLINLITVFLGKDNVSPSTLQQLCSSRFAPANLYGKLANMSADIPSQSIEKTNMFKMLVGNDTIPGEHKFKDTFSFRNFAKLMFSTNQIPHTNDDTRAYFRRWLIIACRNYFPPGKANPKIIEYIATTTELSGLLNYALEGLKRLLEKGMFSDSKTWEEERTKYLASSNTAQFYVENELEYSNSEKATITKEQLFSHYVNYCNERRLPPKLPRDLTEAIRLSIPEAKETQLRQKKGPAKDAWQYIKLKNVSAVSSVSPSLSLCVAQRTENKCIIDKEETALTALTELTTSISKHEEQKQVERDAAEKQGLIPCQFCRAKGKKFWVANDHDLRAHVFAVHPEEYGTPEATQ